MSCTSVTVQPTVQCTHTHTSRVPDPVAQTVVYLEPLRVYSSTPSASSVQTRPSWLPPTRRWRHALHNAMAFDILPNPSKSTPRQKHELFLIRMQEPDALLLCCVICSLYVDVSHDTKLLANRHSLNGSEEAVDFFYFFGWHLHAPPCRPLRLFNECAHLGILLLFIHVVPLYTCKFTVPNTQSVLEANLLEQVGARLVQNYVANR